jgi:uncharacterized protein DUF6263
MRTCVAIVASTVWLVAAPALHAQTTLRWKLQTGDHLDVAIRQRTESDVTYSGKSTKTEIDLGMHLTWRVLAAENGQFRLQQTLDRVTVSLEAPPAGRVQYDTAQANPPAGSAKDIAAALTPLLAAKLKVTMSDRGEIQIQEQTPAKAAAQSNALLSKDSIRQLLDQPLAVLPEKPVNKGEPWTSTANLTTALGKAVQTTTYTYQGPADADGRTLQNIDVSADLQVTPGTSAKITLKTHKQTGTVLFDSKAGRVVSTDQNQTLVTERPYRETTIVVSLTTNTKTTITPTRQPAEGNEPKSMP